MKWLIWFISIFVLLVVSSGIWTELHFLPIIPSALVVLSAVVLSLEEPKDSWTVIVICGILLDFVSGLPDGILLISLLLASGFVYALIYWWLNRDYSIPMLFAASVLLSFLFFIFSVSLIPVFSWLGFPVTADFGFLIIHKTLWYILLNVILVYPIYWYCKLTKHLIWKLKIK